jgi:hypothetical protein
MDGETVHPIALAIDPMRFGHRPALAQLCLFTDR